MARGALPTWSQGADEPADAGVTGEDCEAGAELLKGDFPNGGALEDAHGSSERFSRALAVQESCEAASRRDDGDERDGRRPHASSSNNTWAVPR